MAPSIAPHGAGGRHRSCARFQRRRHHQKTGREARGRQVHKIIEPCRRPTESLMTWRTMADHAVGGVGRLVGHHSGQAANNKPKRRCNHAIGEVLGQRLDGRATDSGLVERRGIASDHFCDGDSARCESAALERISHVGEVTIQASLSDQACRNDNDDDPANRKRQQHTLQQVSDAGRTHHDSDQSQYTVHATMPWRQWVAVQCRIELADDRLKGQGEREQLDILGNRRHLCATVNRLMLSTPVVQNSTNGMLRAPAHLTAPIRSAPLYHGGDLAWAEEHYPDAERPWIDLSTGINPWPYPFAPPPLDTWTRLPAAGLDRQLRNAAATYYGVGDPNAVAAAPGSQALIQVLPRLRPRGSIAIVAPTYGEYAACWEASGHAVVPIATIDAIPAGCDAVVVANPNNPDGRIVPRDRLVSIADTLSRRGGWLVVDEAFADAAPQDSLAERAARPGLIVLRSFGKFFGLAGLRLGFALAAPRLAGALRAALGPWAVSGPASWIGARALADTAWIAAAQTRLGAEAARLDTLLAEASLPVVRGSALFRLVETTSAADLFEHLCRCGVFVRHFAEHPSWLRFGLPESDAAIERLRRVLRAWRGEQR